MPKGAKRWLEFCQYVVPDIVIIIRGHLLLNMRMDWARDDIGQKCNHNLPQGSLLWVLLCMICDNKIEWLHFEQYPDKLPPIFLVCRPLVGKESLGSNWNKKANWYCNNSVNNSLCCWSICQKCTMVCMPASTIWFIPSSNWTLDSWCSKLKKEFRTQKLP